MRMLFERVKRGAYFVQLKNDDARFECAQGSGVLVKNQEGKKIVETGAIFENLKKGSSFWDCFNLGFK